MTNRESIKELKDDCTKCPVMGYKKGAECLDCYINFAIEALEKQTPKRITPDDRDIITCPRCGEEALFEMPGYGSYKYCANCGQAIDWGYDE